jgi:GPH family glycoside/pentoside/hexuronide:cation symporter
MADAAVERELGGLRAKFFLAFGSIGWGVKDAGITGLLLLFYNQVLGVPAYLVSFAIGAALVVDAVIDPIIGVVSDNWNSRWGRRLPFMYVAGVPVGIIYFLLWTPNPHWSQDVLFAYLFVTAVLVRSFIALFEIPSAALVPELTSDYTKRTEFLSWRYLLGVLGASAISFYAFFYLLVPDATHKVGQLNPAGYPKYALIASIIMTGSIVISCLGLHRYIPHLTKPEAKYQSVGQLARELWEAITLKPFFVILCSGLFSGIAAGLSGGMGPYLLTFFWKLGNKQIAAFSFVGMIAALIAFTVVVPITKRFDKKRTAIGSALIAIVFATGPYFLAMFGWVPSFASNTLLPLLLVLFVIMSAVGIAVGVLSGSMIADVVEHAAVKTGRRNEGTFFAALSLMNKSVSGVGIFLSGIVVSLANFPVHADPATLDPSVIRHLLWVYIPVLMALYTGAIFAFSRYRITREEHQENVRRLAEEYALTQVGFEAKMADARLPEDAPGLAAKPAPAGE